MPATFEWDVETVDIESDDILDHRHTETYAEARGIVQRGAPDGCRYSIVLVRDAEDGRSWAYLRDDGTLPMAFRDAHGNAVSPVPPRFFAEVRA